jgi:hypothetical protein
MEIFQEVVLFLTPLFLLTARKFSRGESWDGGFSIIFSATPSFFISLLLGSSKKF